MGGSRYHLNIVPRESTLPSSRYNIKIRDDPIFHQCLLLHTHTHNFFGSGRLNNLTLIKDPLALLEAQRARVFKVASEVTGFFSDTCTGLGNNVNESNRYMNIKADSAKCIYQRLMSRAYRIRVLSSPHESNGILGRGALATISACKLFITSSKSRPENQNFTLQKHLTKTTLIWSSQAVGRSLKNYASSAFFKIKLLPAVLFNSHGHKATMRSKDPLKWGQG